MQATLGCNYFQLIAAIGATIYCKVRLQLSVAIFATDSWRMVAWDDFEFCANFCLLKKSNNKHWRKKEIQIKISKLKCRPFKFKFSEVMNKDKDCRYEEKFNWFYQSWRSLPAASAQSILCEKYPALLFGKTEGKAWFRLLIFNVWLSSSARFSSIFRVLRNLKLFISIMVVLFSETLQHCTFAFIGNSGFIVRAACVFRRSKVVWFWVSKKRI